MAECKERRANIEGIIFGWGNVQNDYEDQSRIAQPFLYILQEMLHLPQKSPPRVIVISNGAVAVGDVCFPSPCGSTAGGICRALVHEAPNVHVKLIDVNPTEGGMSSQADELYSSITGIFGSPGQSNHSSGNSFKDALAHYRYTHGLCATTINWGHWGEVGVAVEYDLPGIARMTTQQGLNALESIMKSHRLQTAVNSIQSFPLLFKTFPHLKNYLDERVYKSEFLTGQSINIKSEEFWEEYDTCGEDRDGKVATIKKYIGITLRHILRLDPQDSVDDNMELQEMGVDSLMMLEMKNSLQSMFGERVTVTPAALKDCSTVNKLGERLVQIIEEEGEFTSKAPPSLDEIREQIKEDSVLPAEIAPNETTLPPVLPSKIRCILVTGATGNLGSYLLSEVLRSCPHLDKIYCLIRHKSGLTPKERLESTLERKCISIGNNLEKIICVEGNLIQSKFGMSDYDYEELTREVDRVLHCAAKISHLEFYRKIEGSLFDIRTVNIRALLNVLEFAVKHRIKHVFNTSTMMSLVKVNPEDGTYLQTWPDADSFDNITNRGYPVSKHVCDVLLKQAVERGVPCKSFKYPEICSETTSNSSLNFESRHFTLIHLYMMKEGIMPSVPFPCNVIPMDVATKITIQICFFHDEAENEMYLVQNPYPQMTQAFFPQLAEEFGYPVKIVEYDEFATSVIEQGEKSILYHFRDLYKDERQFVQGVANVPQNEAARKYLENTDDFFVCKKLKRMVGDLYLGMESSYEIMKRDLRLAQKDGFFEKFGMSTKK
ncbi:Polyketide synthase HetM [Orchesella cincta]|uniref:Polyketide synthase HetM n=1 Tax=Orchesella cincta TaxID=48709 RepID=A0A1D2MTT5_ORCCI|nr:Polyketide synthase HetM [Orchesella cincta]